MVGKSLILIDLILFNKKKNKLLNKNNFINPNAILMELISLKLLFMFFISFTELKSYIFFFSKSKEIS
jgi:hypothetical protein